MCLYSVFVKCVQTEKATDVSQASEDWALYMEICDVINSTEDGYVIDLFVVYKEKPFSLQGRIKKSKLSTFLYEHKNCSCPKNVCLSVCIKLNVSQDK